ncbi:MAG: hypothetical protein GTN38_03960 [Candidatus Aenigmarchaeota archaeon]|nr:hypothetical protein [Candidatus Aenigmarchaeota archaeon]NIP40817.1 hypothetical protein [Candidatus Aenigmarchaeota archaeon]NIQ17931.1 hypothetical protein [Candidatus Aenigmarchaeota archaeon]NIS73520.1 hypothetical protein [Candidatus Aenigmarchaeota archaeon]
MDDEFDYKKLYKLELRKLEPMVISLIGIPDYLGSYRKKMRQYGEMRYDAVIQKISDTNSFNHLDPYEDVHWYLTEYKDFIEKGEFSNAKKVAQEWLRDLRIGLS